MDVSVIVLTYNHEKYIRQALDSILMQKTTFSYEILVGDDASTDGTQEILKEYSERYPNVFRLFLRQKNIGASQNAYELLISAKGEYLATCEGDDYWIDDRKLQIQVSYLKEHPEMIGCVHNCTIVDEIGNPRKNQKLEWVKTKEVFTLQDFQGIYLPGQYATFVRRNIFLNPQYDYSAIYKANSMVADRPAMMLYLQKGDIYHINRVMSCYRKQTKKDSKNITTLFYKNNLNHVHDDYQILNQMEQYSNSVLNCKIRFESRRRELFADAIFQWLRGAGKDNLAIAKKIWSERSGSIRYLLIVPFRFCQKLIRRIVNSRDL